MSVAADVRREVVVGGVVEREGGGRHDGGQGREGQLLHIHPLLPVQGRGLPRSRDRAGKEVLLAVYHLKEL